MKGKWNSNFLKLVAILAMTIDHVTDLLFPGFPAKAVPIGLHLMGRLTAPIMWFFICEGFFYTKNLKKYISRMLLFAVISHFAYNFAFGINLIPFTGGSIFNQTSVIWPLALALIALTVKHKCDSLKEWQKRILITLCILLAFPADWSSIAVLAILDMYENRGDLKKQMKSILLYVFFYALISFFFVSKIYALVSVGVVLVYPVLKHYNGEKGKAGWMKWLFYIYYPLHLLVIGLIRLLLLGDTALIF